MSSYVIINVKFGTKKKVEVFEQEHINCPACHHECVCRVCAYAAIYTLLAVD